MQLESAAEALGRGDVRAARTTLRRLRSLDFSRPEAAEAQLAVLRDLRSESDEIVVAIRKLIGMDGPC
jgi:hypothetical protein